MRIDRALYPFESHSFDRGGLRYHYVDEGAGWAGKTDAPGGGATGARGGVLLFVHGNPTWSFYYRNLIAALRGRYRCVAPDHIGCGLSDKPGDDAYEYTLARRIDDLCALIEQLDLRDLTLVLHDWGGMIGMGAALRFPERVRRLVLFNTAAFLLPAGRTLPLRLRVIRSGGPLAALLVRGGNLFAGGATRMAVTRPMQPEVRAGYLAPYGSWRDRIATLRFVEDIPLRRGDPSYAAAESIDRGMLRFAGLPALICWGMRDFVFDRHFLTEWRRRYPGAEVHEFVEAGHYVLEDAGQEILPILERFLDRTEMPATG